MTAVDWWCLAAAVAAGLGGLLVLVGGPRPIPLASIGHALAAWAVGLLAVAVAVSVL